MKTLLLFLSLVTLTFGKSYCQPYERFVIEGAHWEMWESECVGCNNGYPYPNSNYTHYFKLEGDTTVDSLSYKKLYRSTKGDLFANGHDVFHTCISWTLTALLREDTLTKKVFIIGSLSYNYPACGIASNVDTLLFDFSLSQGDSLSPIGCYDSLHIVDSVKLDSFQTYNAHFGWQWWTRRTQFLYPRNLYAIQGYRMYEGIGPSFGLFGRPGELFEDVYNTSFISYCVGNDSVCGYGCILTAVEDIDRVPEVILYPNPFSTQLTFSLADNVPTTVSLYNFLGQQVLQQTFTNSTTINTAQLADGIYFYELRNSKGTLKTGKVIKQ